MRGRRARLALVASIVASGVVALGLAFLVGDRKSGGGQPAIAALAVHGPERIDAGDPWVIELGAVPETASAIDASIIAPWGVRIVSSSDVGSGSIVVPGDLTRQSGRLVALVRAGDAAARIAVEVDAGAAVDGVIPLAGPRSIVADGADHTMVTAFPRDRFGNVVADGTEVAVVARRPDDRRSVVTTEVNGLVAAARVTSRTTAGRTTLRVDVDGATGPEVDVLEVPGPPVDVALVAPDGPLRADGRSLFTVATGVLADRFGNVVLDGAVAVASIDGPVGRGTARSVTRDGRVELVLEAPVAPGTVSIDLVVDGVRSLPLALEFLPDVAALPVRMGPDGLEVGPVLTVLGGYVPDGTAVTVRTGHTTRHTVLRGAVATVELEAEQVGPVEVEVLGVVAEVVVP